MSSYNPQGIEIGDTVRVKPYQAQTMSGLWHEGYKSNVIGQVCSFCKDYDWRSGPNMVRFRALSADSYAAWFDNHSISEVELIKKGNGTFEVGVTQPFSWQELRDQRLAVFEAKLWNVDTTHQGFSNAATFLVHLYLNQDARILAQVHTLRRKDGTINPVRLKKLFFKCRLKVDDWAFEPPLEVPDEFKHWAHRWRQRVNWHEVADNFKEEC